MSISSSPSYGCLNSQLRPTQMIHPVLSLMCRVRSPSDWPNTDHRSFSPALIYSPSILVLTVRHLIWCVFWLCVCMFQSQVKRKTSFSLCVFLTKLQDRNCVTTLVLVSRDNTREWQLVLWKPLCAGIKYVWILADVSHWMEIKFAPIPLHTAADSWDICKHIWKHATYIPNTGEQTLCLDVFQLYKIKLLSTYLIETQW